MRKVFWAFQAVVFYLFTRAFATIPQTSIQEVGSCVGRILFRLLPGRRKIAIDNISQALPHMQQSPEWSCRLKNPVEIARETFIRLGISLVETCRLYHGKGKYLLDTIEIRGMEHYEAARAQGKGVIFLTGHCGNWELGALAFSHLINVPVSVVARRQNNPYLNGMIEKMRVQYQNRIIYKDNAMRSMISVIRKKGIVGLLIDQAVFPDEGALITFLGRNAWASRVPVILARKTGVVVLPIFTHREDERNVVTVSPPCVFGGPDSDAGMTADVKRYSEYIERSIIAHPTDWYWVHRRWKRAGEQMQ
jgi:KDO2-lipid IV(A) lauroyltransferase